MPWHRSVIAKLRNLVARGQSDREFDAELQAHLTMLAERFVRQGMRPEDARSAARRQFGNKSLLKETKKEMSSFPSLESFWQDIQYASRTLRKHAVLSVAVAATLTLGIGLDTGVFSMINAIAFRARLQSARH
jgi:hypothetical protein